MKRRMLLIVLAVVAVAFVASAFARQSCPATKSGCQLTNPQHSRTCDADKDKDKDKGKGCDKDPNAVKDPNTTTLCAADVSKDKNTDGEKGKSCDKDPNKAQDQDPNSKK
jgi:Ni/Co efflux regulator RcnB